MKFLVWFACAIAAASAGVIIPVHHHHVPVIANGVPVDTVEVQQAKAEHFAAKAEAHARNGDYIYGLVPTVYSAPVLSAIPAPATWTGPQHIPVITENGVPEETPEVKQAKAEHLAAKADAEAQTPTEEVDEDAATKDSPVAVDSAANDAPATVTETPEVAAATKEHLTAHAEARARTGPVAYTAGYYTPYVAPYVHQYSHYYGYSAPYVHYY